MYRYWQRALVLPCALGPGYLFLEEQILSHWICSLGERHWRAGFPSYSTAAAAENRIPLDRKSGRPCHVGYASHRNTFCEAKTTAKEIRPDGRVASFQRIIIYFLCYRYTSMVLLVKGFVLIESGMFLNFWGLYFAFYYVRLLTYLH